MTRVSSEGSPAPDHGATVYPPATCSVDITRDVEAFGASTNLRIANRDAELILPTEFGPRVLSYARIGGRNVLGVLPAHNGQPTPYGDVWHSRGGHRLWYAPEASPRSYYPDNAPVRVEIAQGEVTLTQAVESHTQLEKRIHVALASAGTRVEIRHVITNQGALDVEIAPWALTVMAPGGRALYPQPPFVPHPTALAPVRPLVQWAFTKMADARWTWGNRAIILRHDPTMRDAQKIGMYDREGWAAYLVGDELFIKYHDPVEAPHADYGCNVETFANDAVLEIETLGPLCRLVPGGSVEHRERWALFGEVRLDQASDPDALRDAIEGYVARGRAEDSA